MKRIDSPILEPSLDNGVILVKESPKKVVPKLETASSRDAGVSKNSWDEGSVKMTSSGDKENLKENKNLFGSAVSFGNVLSPTHSITELIKGKIPLSMYIYFFI